MINYFFKINNQISDENKHKRIIYKINKIKDIYYYIYGNIIVDRIYVNITCSTIINHTTNVLINHRILELKLRLSI